MNVDDLVVAHKRDIAEEQAHLRARNVELESRINELRVELGNRKDMAAHVAKAVISAEPFKRVPYKSPPKPGSAIEPVFKLSDWQIGEVVDPDKTEGFGQFNWDIAQKRIFSMTDAFLAWIEMQRSVYRIDRIRIFLEGDPISGDIHRELEVTNEFPVPVQTANAGLLTGEVIARIAPHAAEVIVEGITADNHGRLTKKNQWKEGGLNNMAYLVSIIARQYLRNVGNVDFRAATGRVKDLFDVCGKKFLVEHGHAVKAWMGDLRLIDGCDALLMMPGWKKSKGAVREHFYAIEKHKAIMYEMPSEWHERTN